VEFVSLWGMILSLLVRPPSSPVPLREEVLAVGHPLGGRPEEPHDDNRGGEDEEGKGGPQGRFKPKLARPGLRLVDPLVDAPGRHGAPEGGEPQPCDLQEPNGGRVGGGIILWRHIAQSIRP